jgi:hypothetical protein
MAPTGICPSESLLDRVRIRGGWLESVTVDSFMRLGINDLRNPSVRYLRQSRRLERLEPLKAVGGVTPGLNADLRGQKPMRRFPSPPNKSMFVSAFISVSQCFKIRSCQTLKLPGRARGLLMELPCADASVAPFAVPCLWIQGLTPAGSGQQGARSNNIGIMGYLGYS